MMKRMNFNINPSLIDGEETGEVVRGPIMQFLHNFFSHFDLMQVIPALILVSAGILFIYGTGEQAGYGAGLFWKRQFFYAIAGVCVWLFLTFFDYRWLSPASVPFYIFSNILLVAVLFLGPEVNHAHRWLDIGGYSLQPSEFGKLAVESAIAPMAEMVKKAIAEADENRKSGKRIEVKSPVLVVEEGSDEIAVKA